MTDLTDIVIPDVMGEYEGWRAWSVVGPPVKPRLYSQYHHHAGGRGSLSPYARWPRTRWMEAACPKRVNLENELRERGVLGPELDEHLAAFDQAHGPIPGERCSCGLYAAVSREHLLDLTRQGIAYQAYTLDKLTVIGRVGLAGVVVSHARGYKASKARVLELFVPQERWQHANGLKAAYGVPVRLDNTWRDTISPLAQKMMRKEATQ